MKPLTPLTTLTWTLGFLTPASMNALLISPSVTLPASVTMMTVPPMNSMPKVRPRIASAPIETISRTAEIANMILR